ncbi:MAG: radical SAM protein [Nitrospirae bacterium]|nr:radical SAM protein [Nitrospirota bacterium]
MAGITSFRARDIKTTHPCFSKEAHHKFGRIHLPVAPACNIQCRYCIRKYDCANESRPGITSRVLTPSDAVERVRALAVRNEKLTVVGIAGPGDPLANEATFETMAAISREFPGLTLCVSTNGLYLPDRLEDLLRAGVRSITITINALTHVVAEKIYSWVTYHGKTLTGREAAGQLLVNQQRGLINAIDAGFMVKVNTVYIPGVNDAEIPLVAWFAGVKGADIMNIIPLIPQAGFESFQRPTAEMISKMRNECAPHIEQMTHCRQCRADACGALGEDKDMELEVLNAAIGEEYCEMV